MRISRACSLRIVKFRYAVLCAVGFLGLVGYITPATAQVANTNQCELSSTVDTDGIRRLALIVGVGDYQAERVNNLPGPPNDAERFSTLLTDPKGYGFPAENVCTIVNKDATKEQFIQLFNQHLIANSRENDIVVIFFAGHGSQVIDRNGDETDGRDETLLFYDYVRPGVGDLRDDTFNDMLVELQNTGAKTTLILDTCNSGTATRGLAGTYQARFYEEDMVFEEDSSVDVGDGDDSDDFVPQNLPGMVILTAASDGSVALEKNGGGVFTDALIQILGEVSSAPLTYAQVARRILPLVTARSPQIPFLSGDLASVVFENETRRRPLAWEVTAVSPKIIIEGPPLPGGGVGAEYRIYDGLVNGSDLNDPSLGKSVLVVTKSTGVRSETRVAVDTIGAEKISIGDLATLVRPADNYIKVSVRIRPEDEADGVPSALQRRIEDALTNNPEAKLLLTFSEDAGDFEIRQRGDKKLVLYGPENRIRNVFTQPSSAVENLRLHARQMALLQLRGEGGSDFTDDSTLEVQLVPATGAHLPECADGTWIQQDPHVPQVIPLCHDFNIRVKHTGAVPIPLLVGGLIFSSSGDMYGFPVDGREVLLNSGEEVVFDADGETLQGGLPLDVWDTVVMFGTQKKNPIVWKDLTETASTRSAITSHAGPLYEAIDKYLQPGSRGISPKRTVKNASLTWTMSTLKAKVEANSRFLNPKAASLNAREYTIANFDLRPYLPDDKTSALYKVLTKADELAKAKGSDGYGYKQHDWSLASDLANLEKGIDCSRAIWFAFTRSDQPYNSKSDRYLPTVSMVNQDSLMAEQFERCDTEPVQLGDVIVYRDDIKGDGHVVIAIDPLKRIAWGSHGWDGNGRQADVEADNGVEYQLFKYKKDWERWDRSTMEKKACWRYKAFIKERSTGKGLPGVAALNNVCDDENKCGFPLVH